jgi:hypothetical protein
MASAEFLDFRILSRNSSGNLTQKSWFVSNDYDIIQDYIDNSQSSVTIIGAKNYAAAKDIILVYFQNGKYFVNNSSTPLFLGVVDGIEDDTINFYNILNILNEDSVQTTSSGSDLISQLTNYFNYNWSQSDLQAPTVSLNSDTDVIPWAYKVDDDLSIGNTLDYLINMFQSYGVAFVPQNIVQSSTNSNTYNLKFDLRAYKKSQDGIQLANNTNDTINLNKNITSQGAGDVNKLEIIDETTKDMFAPTILSTWYLNEDLELTQDVTDNVKIPTKRMQVTYDNSATDKEPFQQVAQENLQGNTYNHEITFDLDLSSDKFKFSFNQRTNGCFYFGNLVDLWIDHEEIPSFLTAWEFSASNPGYVTITLGNYRSTLTSAIGSVQSFSSGRTNIENMGIRIPVGGIFLTTNSDDSTSINFPPYGAWQEIQGKFLVGYNPNDTNFSTVGKTGGADSVTLTATEIPNHTHDGENSTTGNNYVYTEDSGFAISIHGAASGSSIAYMTTKTGGASIHDQTGGVHGTHGGAHQNLPPYQTIRMWERIA